MLGKRFSVKKSANVFFVLLFLCFCSCAESSNITNEKNNKINPDYFSAGRFAATVIGKNSEIYFARNDGIYKQVNNETAKRIIKINSPDFLLIDGNRLYFTEHEQQETLYSVGLDGSNYRKDFSCSQFSDIKGIDLINYSIVNGVLYAANGQGAFSYCFENKKLTRLVTEAGVSAYEVYGGNFYYIDHTARTFTVYAINLSNNNQTVIIGEAKEKPKQYIYYDFWWLDGEICFAQRNPNGLFCGKVGEKPKLIDARETEAVWKQNGKLYYIVKTDNGQNKLCCYSNKKSDTVFVLQQLECDFSKGLRFINNDLYYNSGKQVKIYGDRQQDS